MNIEFSNELCAGGDTRPARSFLSCGPFGWVLAVRCAIRY